MTKPGIAPGPPAEAGAAAAQAQVRREMTRNWRTRALVSWVLFSVLGYWVVAFPGQFGRDNVVSEIILQLLRPVGYASDLVPDGWPLILRALILTALASMWFGLLFTVTYLMVAQVFKRRNGPLDSLNSE